MSTNINIKKQISIQEESILLTNDVSNINFIGAGVTASNIGNEVTVNIPGSAGSVTNVTGTAPIVSSGGTTPAISIPQATNLTDGYLSSADWTVFNNKVPSTRTITINGVTNDLSANRSWTIAAAIPASGTSAARRAVVSPAVGDRFYDTDLERYMTWNGTIWTGPGIVQVVNKTAIDMTANNWNVVLWDAITNVGVQRTTTTRQTRVAGVIVDGNIADGLMTVCTSGVAKCVCTGAIIPGSYLVTSTVAGAAYDYTTPTYGVFANAQEARSGAGTSVVKITFQATEQF